MEIRYTNTKDMWLRGLFELSLSSDNYKKSVHNVKKNEAIFFGIFSVVVFIFWIVKLINADKQTISSFGFLLLISMSFAVCAIVNFILYILNFTSKRDSRTLDRALLRQINAAAKKMQESFDKEITVIIDGYIIKIQDYIGVRQYYIQGIVDFVNSNDYVAFSFKDNTGLVIPKNAFKCQEKLDQFANLVQATRNLNNK